MAEQISTPAPAAGAGAGSDPVSLITGGLSDRAAARGQTSADAAPAAAAPPADGSQPGSLPKPEAPAAPAAPDGDLARLINAAVAAATKPLNERLEQMSKAGAQTEAARRGEDARNELLRALGDGVPAEIYRQLLPATTDKAELQRAADRLREQTHGWINRMIQSGDIFVGGDGKPHFGKSIGGDVPRGPRTMGPMDFQPPAGSPVEEIAAGLSAKGRR